MATFELWLVGSSGKDCCVIEDTKTDLLAAFENALKNPGNHGETIVKSMTTGEDPWNYVLDMSKVVLVRRRPATSNQGRMLPGHS
jgi:hypothetical protein